MGSTKKKNEFHLWKEIDEYILEENSCMSRNHNQFPTSSHRTCHQKSSPAVLKSSKEQNIRDPRYIKCTDEHHIEQENQRRTSLHENKIPLGGSPSENEYEPSRKGDDAPQKKKTQNEHNPSDKDNDMQNNKG